MAIGIKSSGNVDFDSLFEPRTSSKINNTGLQSSAGTDISNLYERLSSGSAISSNTGVQNSAGTDCRSLFAAIGSVSYWDGNFTNDPYSESASASSDDAQASLIMYSDGTVRTSSTNFGTRTKGRWDGDDANSSNTEVKIVVNHGQNVSINHASTWVNLTANRTIQVVSDGIGPNGAGFADGVVEIRQSGTTSPVIRADFNIYAEAQGDFGLV